ncbi:unnamed protein product [Blepharisma stoltei]|uniref:TPX2 C-terminal domain-containing protein n=1 Tax=Blepharisma stoltei TaxID=1481888 RepID=A0AAU9ICZ4_9CILI|nr:unnamed protein product [Blepharisma stoltei]
MEQETSSFKRKLNNSLCLSVPKKRKLIDEESCATMQSLNKSSRSALKSLDINLIGIPHHCAERSQHHPLKLEKQQIKPFKALPMPKFPPPSIHVSTKETTKPMNVTLHSEIRNAKREKYDEMMKILKEKIKIDEEKVKKEKEIKEIEDIRKSTQFKARPLPDYAPPLQPMKSVKPLTVPMEPKFLTEIRAQIREMKKVEK